jgi:hypothetical protein
MGFTIDFSVLNQKGTPALYSDIFANRPAAGYQGRLFIATDTAAIYEDTGTAWTLIANVSSGAGTLQQVTTNGNTSNVGISVTAGGVSTNSATITSLTTGSVPFAGAGGLISQDNANLFWDDTNNRLGINTNTPGNSLDVHATGTNPILALNNTAGNQSAVSFLNTSVAKWRIGNAVTNTLDIYNFTLAAIALQIKANNEAVFISSVQADDFVVQPTGYSILAALSRNLTGAGYGVLSLRNSAVGTIQPSTLSVDRTYTLPDATGTIALTSNLSAYLPLTGGTLTGTLTLSGSAAECFIIQTPNATSLNSKYVYNTNTTLGYIGTGQGLITGGGSTIFAIRSENSMALSTNGGDIAMTITKATKNVLINSTTDDTVNKLQVAGSTKITGTSTVEGSINMYNYTSLTTSTKTAASGANTSFVMGTDYGQNVGGDNIGGLVVININQTNSAGSEGNAAYVGIVINPRGANGTITQISRSLGNGISALSVTMSVNNIIVSATTTSGAGFRASLSFIGGGGIS